MAKNGRGLLPGWLEPPLDWRNTGEDRRRADGRPCNSVCLLTARRPVEMNDICKGEEKWWTLTGIERHIEFKWLHIRAIESKPKVQHPEINRYLPWWIDKNFKVKSDRKKMNRTIANDYTNRAERDLVRRTQTHSTHIWTQLAFGHLLFIAQASTEVRRQFWISRNLKSFSQTFENSDSTKRVCIMIPMMNGQRIFAFLWIF